jgi:hypothetical protein
VTTADHLGAAGPSAELLASVPELRHDLERRDFDGESVVWSPIASFAMALDPVATLMLEVVDGSASISELADDVHETVAIPLPEARHQVARIVELYASAGLLTSSTSTSNASEEIAARDLFIGAATPCAENASRLGTETLHLCFGEKRIRITCDSRRGARRLRAALTEHLGADEAEDAPLGFVLTAPQGLQRHHRLEDRSGFVLSEARGLDAGLRALASHLTALLPPAPGTVRFRARAVGVGGRTIVCLPPLLYFPALPESELKARGIQLVDRLALDVDVRSGEITVPEIPWPALASLRSDSAHLGTGADGTPSALVVLGDEGSPTPSRATAVAQVASTGLSGTPAELLDAATSFVETAEIRPTAAESAAFLDALTA